MWASLWPRGEAQIGHVTNGVHLGTWLAPELDALLRERGVRPEAPPDEARLGRPRSSSTRTRSGDVHAGLQGAARRRDRASTAERLTIGFARRFATYKRAGLVFTDLERLLALPVQIVVAGKAHPQDVPGKDVMQHDRRALPRPGASPGRVVFLENYDIALARAIIPGVRRLAEHTRGGRTRRRGRAA